MTLRAVISSLICAAALLAAAQAHGQEAEGGGAKAQITRQVFIYDPGGRRDPFISLVKPVEEERPKTGIPWLDYDVSQMRVVAIVWDRAGRYALFGLPDGKHYTVKEGMTVGIHGGKVMEILRDAVLVREMKPDYRGVQRPVDTYLRLRKEEGR